MLCPSSKILTTGPPRWGAGGPRFELLSPSYKLCGVKVTVLEVIDGCRLEKDIRMLDATITKLKEDSTGRQTRNEKF